MKFAIRKYFFLVAALFSLSRVFSQQPDTVVVYEYIYKTDTVWMELKPVHDTIVVEKLQRIEDATIVFDPVSKGSKLIYFFPGGGATIPVNRILLNENHLKIDKMKRVSFFTMFFLALQSIAYAQPDISVKAGISHYWYNSDIYSKGGFLLGEQVGFEMKGPLAKKNLSFSVGYDYQALIDELNFSYFDTISGVLLAYNRMMKTYHSFPILFYYKINQVELFAGYEFRSVRTDLSTTSVDNHTSNSFYTGYEHAFSFGIEYKLNNRLSTCGKYSIEGFWFDKMDDKLKAYGGRIDLGIKYYLYRNPSFLNVN
jgi:hypothetical protein